MKYYLRTAWLLLSVFACTRLVEGREYYVHPNDQEHRCPVNSSCFDLAYFVASSAANGNETYNDYVNDAVVNFLEGVYLLNESEPILIVNAEHLTLQGPDTTSHVGFHETVKQSSVKIVCQSSATTGFVFYRSDYIVIKGITLIGCGAPLSRSNAFQNVSTNDTFFTGLPYAALAFLSVTNVALHHVSVLNGTEYGLLAINALDVVISDSSFSGANWEGQCRELASSIVCQGGNAMFFFRSHIKCSLHPYFIDISNSNFSFGMNSRDMSGGLGFLMLQGPSIGIDVTLNSVVAFNNVGENGANLLYVTSSLVTAHSLTILNSHISNGNKILSSAINSVSLSGGGVLFSTGHIVDHPYTECNSMPSEDIIPIGVDSGSGVGNTKYCSWAERCFTAPSETLLHIENTTISGNSAMYGGGLFVTILSPVGILQRVNIINSIITSNTGFAGSGVFLEEFDYLDLDTTLEINVNNVTVSHNLPHPRFEEANEACAFYISSVDNLHLNDLVVSMHVTTGMIMYNSFVVLSGNNNAIFGNSGQYGGGLALFGSYLFLYKQTRISFMDNHASEKGGAIYVKKSDLDQYCSIQSDSRFEGDGTMLFTRNSADKAGSVLYGENVESCIPFIYDYRKSNMFFNRSFVMDEQNGSSLISSDPISVCFCENGLPDCSMNYLNYTVLPGKVLYLPLVLMGHGDGLSTGILNIMKEVNNMDGKMEELIELSSECSVQPYPVLVNTTGWVNVALTLKVADSSYIKTYQGSARYVNVSVAPCPLGFELSAGECTCWSNMTEAIAPSTLTCNISTEQLERKGDAWIGYDNSTECVVTFSGCPFDYCNTEAVTFTLAAPDAQCSLNRSGTLCGQCADGLSLLLGSNKCGHCHNGYLALILPFAIAGIVLVVLIIALNLTVSGGAINGLIFYANVIKINETIFFSNGPIPFLSQFIAWINLDLGIQTCFFDGMNSYWKTWLQFVFPLYIWALIFVMIFVCRYSMRLSQLMGNNAVPVVATLFLLSYTKLFRLVVTILQMVTLTCSSSTDSQNLWMADPGIEYLSVSHAFLVVSAICVLVFITLPYTLILLFGPLLEKYLPRSKRLRPVIIKLKPFLDSYNGPYKDKLRFWTGLLLLIRLFIVLVSIGANDNTSIIVVISTISLLLSITTCCGGVYRKKHLTVFECWFFLNLAILSTLATNAQADIFITVSLCLVFLSFAGIVIYQLVARFELDTKILITAKYVFKKRLSRISDTHSTDDEFALKERYSSVSSTVVDIEDLHAEQETYNSSEKFFTVASIANFETAPTSIMNQKAAQNCSD